MNEGICCSVPPGILKCCGYVDTKDQVYMFQYVKDNLWGNVHTFNYHAILEKHYHPIREVVMYS